MHHRIISLTEFFWSFCLITLQLHITSMSVSSVGCELLLHTQTPIVPICCSHSPPFPQFIQWCCARREHFINICSDRNAVRAMHKNSTPHSTGGWGDGVDACDIRTIPLSSSTTEQNEYYDYMRFPF